MDVSRRATIAEIARLAGVGTATVDRVLHNRGTVRETTRQRVEQARAAIESGAPMSPRARPWRLKVLLPELAGASTDYLGRCLQACGAKGNATVECVFARRLEPAALARKLRACAGQGIDAVAFQALEDPRVHDAVDFLHDVRIPALALLSGLANPNIIGTVGIDNRAAGRTAGHLMGRLTRQAGQVVIVTAGSLYRLHEDREMGFRAALRTGFPHITETIVLNGEDDGNRNFTVMREALTKFPDLVGVYNVGGGHEGIVNAMQEAGVVGELVHIGHNLSQETRSFLIDGSMDIVLHLDMSTVAELAVEAMVAQLEQRQVSTGFLPTGIVTRENTFGFAFS
ncbi:LacI family DNA-binding transcriptional regulator [Tropicimonas marinistellae]|uniref:LacI family DNA-binding transcriptional regulator n=1 Tax=Tropicimonas marinistellae TaxID=1739787 RepID=UPI0008302FA1|nr:LacI family DNA-binding transcriptional regulator [Tropicimonas marinistellae]